MGRLPWVWGGWRKVIEEETDSFVYYPKSVGCESTLWMVGTTIEISVSAVLANKIFTTQRPYYRRQHIFWLWRDEYASCCLSEMPTCIKLRIIGLYCHLYFALIFSKEYDSPYSCARRSMFSQLGRWNQSAERGKLDWILPLKRSFRRSKFSQRPENGPKIGAKSVTAQRLASTRRGKTPPSEQSQSVLQMPPLRISGWRSKISQW